jgi:hypothetical protein
VVVGGEVVEIAGVEEDVVVAEEVDGEGLIGGEEGGICGVAESGVPASFGMEEFAVWVGAELGLKMRKIYFYAGKELRAEGVALGEESGEGGLGGGAERKICVGDDFKAVEGGADLSGGSGYGEPSNFHLGKSGDFGEAAEGEGEDFVVGRERFVCGRVKGEIEENFIDDEDEIMFFADGVEAGEFFGLDIGPGGVVWMDKENGAGARRDGGFEGLKIDEPAVGVGERVGLQKGVLEAAEKFKEWIAGFRKQEFVAGIRQEAEGVGVGFAGAGGEEEGFGVDGGLVIVEVVAGYFLAGGKRAFGLRVVAKRGGVLEGG